MLPTQKEQELKYIEIFNSDLEETDLDVTFAFAKWYAEQVIKHCAEVAKISVHCRIDSMVSDYQSSKESDDFNDFTIDKQSILNVINEL